MFTLIVVFCWLLTVVGWCPDVVVVYGCCYLDWLLLVDLDVVGCCVHAVIGCVGSVVRGDCCCARYLVVGRCYVVDAIAFGSYVALLLFVTVVDLLLTVITLFVTCLLVTVTRTHVVTWLLVLIVGIPLVRLYGCWTLHAVG